MRATPWSRLIQAITAVRYDWNWQGSPRFSLSIVYFALHVLHHEQRTRDSAASQPELDRAGTEEPRDARLIFVHRRSKPYKTVVVSQTARTRDECVFLGNCAPGSSSFAGASTRPYKLRATTPQPTGPSARFAARTAPHTQPAVLSHHQEPRSVSMTVYGNAMPAPHPKPTGPKGSTWRARGHARARRKNEKEQGGLVRHKREDVTTSNTDAAERAVSPRGRQSLAWVVRNGAAGVVIT